MLAILPCLVGPRSATAEGAAAAFAAQAPTDWDQCQVLLALCHAAVVAGARADGTPMSGRTDRLVTRQYGEAALAARDAHDAATVIEQRHGGRRLRCFDDPECRFLGMPSREAPTPPRKKP